MSPPLNNLDELHRKHALPTVSSPSKPATPHTNGGKGKFKPAKSLPTPSTVDVTLRKLPSFSTPGFGKSKPTSLNLSSVADNSVPYVDVSSAETIALSTSSSSIPSKRLSSGLPEDLVSLTSPKRPRTDDPQDKENFFQDDLGDKGKGKGKERARDTVLQSTTRAPPSRIVFPSPRLPALPSPALIPVSVSQTDCKALSYNISLNEKNERELRAACNTAQDLIEACDKLIGMARADSSDPKDIEFLNFLNELLEKRLGDARAQLKATLRGERPPSTNATITSTDLSLGNVNPEEDYWGPFDDRPIELVEEPPRILTPATPPATQPRPLPPVHALPPIPGPSVSPKFKATDYTKRPYYKDVLAALQQTFGLESFRPKQLDAICAAMDGLDVFVLFPTGSGKSLTFQIPALCQNGVTVVVSPLVSLMRDQVQALLKRKVDVVQLSGDLKEEVRNKVKQQLRSKDKPSLLYVTPEQLQRNSWMQATLSWLYENNQLSRFVIDEAHCISDWGRRFRDSYTQLAQLRKVYPKVPISALTATANAQVEHDIVYRLAIPDCVRLKLSFNRPNLDYEVRPKKNTKLCLADIVTFINEHHPRDTGIIYCLSRANCEDVAKDLRELGLNAKHYHASMDIGDRMRVQEEWYTGKVRIIVATVAFGMGIDKADVRYVIHFTLPSTLSGYYQETGRAGRDGKPAHCILYYQYGDAAQRLDLIRKGEEPEEEKRWTEEDFKSVIQYCENDVRCRRQQVLDFFGEEFNPVNCHRLCNNCREVSETTSADHTEQAKLAAELLESLSRMGAQLTRDQFVSALKGSKVKAMRDKGCDKDPLYGACQNLTRPVLERLVGEMLFADVLTTARVRVGEYTYSYMRLGRKASDLKRGKLKLVIEFRVTTKTPTVRAPRKPNSRAAQNPVPVDSAPVAGPSRVSSSRKWNSSRPLAVPADDSAEKISLYRDDPEDDLEWQDDDIEEISSPPPRAPSRRMGTRSVPSVSHSALITTGADWDSNIEEISSPIQRTYRVTEVGIDDIPTFGSDGNIESCRDELRALREKIREEGNQELVDALNENTVWSLAVMPSDSSEALQAQLSELEVPQELLGKWEKDILGICAKYHEP